MRWASALSTLSQPWVSSILTGSPSTNTVIHRISQTCAVTRVVLSTTTVAATLILYLEWVSLWAQPRFHLVHFQRRLSDQSTHNILARCRGEGLQAQEDRLNELSAQTRHISCQIKALKTPKSSRISSRVSETFRKIRATFEALQMPPYGAVVRGSNLRLTVWTKYQYDMGCVLYET